jgi:parvulin-like peptidyl-prolyl isomerase
LTLDEARSTAVANFGEYESNILEAAHMSREDYERLYARPQLARQRVRDVLTADVGQAAPQVHASHILVSTRELADQIYADVTTGGLDFATVAKEKSTDTGTAANGGDLGWFTRGVMVAPFEDVAFATEAGQIAPPVQTEFGWHVIYVIERDDDRPMSDDQIQRYQDSIVDRWLKERIAASQISSDIPPTATPMTNTFVPPPDAPTPPPPTEIPAASPVASPVASPAASPATAPSEADGTPTA